MDSKEYREQIIQLVQKINDAKLLRYLYTLVREMNNKETKKE